MCHVLRYFASFYSGNNVELAGQPDPVTITGIDEYGYLRVRTVSSDVLTVQPDGNTFDIMKGLIKIK